MAGFLHYLDDGFQVTNRSPLRYLIHATAIARFTWTKYREIFMAPLHLGEAGMEAIL
jgi:hypothetical protein